MLDLRCVYEVHKGYMWLETIITLSHFCPLESHSAPTLFDYSTGWKFSWLKMNTCHFSVFPSVTLRVTTPFCNCKFLLKYCIIQPHYCLKWIRRKCSTCHCHMCHWHHFWSAMWQSLPHPLLYFNRICISSSLRRILVSRMGPAPGNINKDLKNKEVGSW